MTRQFTLGLCLLALSLPFTTACKDKKAEDAAKKRIEEEKAQEKAAAAEKEKKEREKLRETMLTCKKDCAAKLEKLGLALTQYSNENRFFPHMKSWRQENASTDVAKVFETLVYYKFVDDVKLFTCPGSKDKALERDKAVLNNSKLFQWKKKGPAKAAVKPIARGAGPDIYKDKDFTELSFTYRKRLLNVVGARSDTILAADRYPHHKNKKGEWGYNVLYGDCQVKFIPVSNQSELLRLSDQLHFARPGSEPFKEYKKAVMDPQEDRLGDIFEAMLTEGPKRGKSLVGGLLGSIFGAKEKANRTKCANNLRTIGLGMIMYSNDYRFFPHMKPFKEENASTDVEKIYRSLIYFNYLDNVENFVCPSSEDLVFRSEPAVIDDPKLFQWKGKTASKRVKPILGPTGPDIYADDFVQLSYTCYRRRINSASARSDTILAADRFPHHHSGSTSGYNVVYADGHVNFVTLEDKEELKRLYKALHLAKPGSKAYEKYRKAREGN